MSFAYRKGTPKSAPVNEYLRSILAWTIPLNSSIKMRTSEPISAELRRTIETQEPVLLSLFVFGVKMAKLTSKQRNRLKSSEFAEPGKRKFPINDRNHAKNALARVSQFGSSSEKAAVKRKVHSKFPGIAVGGKSKHKKAHHKRSMAKR